MTIPEIIKMYEQLLTIPENIAIRDMVFDYLDANGFEKKILPNIVPEARPQAKKLLTKSLMDKAFHFAQWIYLYHNEPDKVMQWLIYNLQSYSPDLMGLFIKMLVSILKDKRRFDHESNGLAYIIKQIERPDFDQLKSHYNPQENEIRYFTGNDSIDATPIPKAYLKVRGIHLTKAEEYKQYIEQNYSPELIEAFKEIYKMPESNIKKDESLQQIFYSNAIDTFLQHEARFITDGFLNADLTLKGEKQKAVALIYILKGRGYLKPITGKDKSNHFKVYRQFFEQRYNTNLVNMAKPTNFPPKKAKTFEPDFFFIEAIK